MSKAVYAKILELQKAVKALKKDSKSYNFEYLSGDKLFEVVRPKMDELGLLLLPDVVKVESTPTTYAAWDNKLKSLVQKTENLVALDINFTWVDVESGETVVQHWHGTGQNGFDKSFGSALTYAERYFLLKTFHIATNKDDVDALAEIRDKAIEDAAAAVAQEAAAIRARNEENAAPVQTTAQPKFETVKDLKADKEFWQWVEAAAIGKLSRQGRPAWEGFTKKYNPTKDQLDAFWDCVNDRKEALAYEAENRQK